LGTLLSAIEYRKQIRGEWLLGLAGAFTVAFGIYLLVRPIVALALLPLFIGSYALVWGVLLLAAASRLWRRRDRVASAWLSMSRPLSDRPGLKRRRKKNDGIERRPVCRFHDEHR